MTSPLRQSTAITVKIGPFLDALDGVTEETLLSPGVELSKGDSTSFASKNEGTTPTHDIEAWYDCELDTTDTNTLGRMILKAHDSANHIPVWHEFEVIPQAVYDALYAGTGKLITTLQIPAVDAAAMALAGTITVRKSTTWNFSITGLGNLTGYDDVILSVKSDPDHADTEAILRVTDDNDLERFEGAAPIASTNGTLTIDDDVAGDISIMVKPAETDGATIRRAIYYDVKGITAAGVVDLLTYGERLFNVEHVVTRAIT